MNKILSAFIAAALSAAVTVITCGCSAEEGNDTADTRVSVVTTIFPAYDLARQVFGDSADVTLLLSPGTESHTYDPSARDIVKISGCSLFIYNGGESDEWVKGILGSVGNINTFRMMDCVPALKEEHTEGMSADDTDDHDEHGDEYDEHIWTSPANAAAIVTALGKKAGELFPENAALYSERAESYADLISVIDADFMSLLKNENRYFVFGDRFPLLYFFRRYGLNYYAAFPGCGSEVEPSARTVTFLLDKLSDEDTIKAVFYIELSDRRLAASLSEDSGVPAAEFHTCHNITADDFAAGETYVSLMRRNYETLSGILGGS